MITIIVHAFGYLGELMKQFSDWKALLTDSALAHVMKFTSPLSPAYSSTCGNRLLVAFLLIGIGFFLCLRLALQAGALHGLPEANLVFVVILIAVYFVMQRVYIGLPPTALGLRTLAQWTRRERLYFIQVVPLASVLFLVLFKEHLIALMELHGTFRFLFFTVLTGLLWGFIQELIYRGWLQTELTRRFGAAAGLLAANIIFTFGPLHLNLLTSSNGPQWGVIAAVFGIGLFFGLVYQRSGNLWIPAILHGLWPLNMS